MEKPIVCLGILVADIVGRPLTAVPEPGRLVLVDEMHLLTGGCAVNSSSTLALLGLPVQAVGKVGQDILGEFVIQAMRGRGVGTQGVKRDQMAGTSVTMVLVEPDGERRFVHYIGANARLTLDDIDLQQVRSAAILHIAGALVLPGIDGQPTARLLQEARRAGVVTALDTVWDATGRWMQLLAPCLPHLDYFVPSLPEAQAITGRQDPAEVAQFLLDRGVGTVALKMGAEGSLVATQQGEMYRLPAFRVEVIDATGAGDAFAAGFLAGIWQGWPLEQTARFANAVGALCVTGLGALGGVRSLPETLEFMDRAEIRKEPQLNTDRHR
jgi:sugar/nucleoside kinase (ribokinase family)